MHALPRVRLHRPESLRCRIAYRARRRHRHPLGAGVVRTPRCAGEPASALGQLRPTGPAPAIGSLIDRRLDTVPAEPAAAPSMHHGHMMHEGHAPPDSAPAPRDDTH